MESSIDGHELPLQVIPDEEDAGRKASMRQQRKLPRSLWLPFVPLLLFTGGFIGIYVQPPALRIFLRITGLKPGGGTSSPIAVPAVELADQVTQSLRVRSVVALGKLVPEGKIITVAPPYGAGDARVDALNVEIGAQVTRGDTLALLDNLASLEANLLSAQANLALQESTLEQTRLTVASNRDEALASLDQARTSQNLAKQELDRFQMLIRQKAISKAELDQATATFEQALKDVARARANLNRYDATTLDEQADVAVAARGIDTARAELNRAKRDLARGTVTSPVTGTVLNIHTRPGERPGDQGILDIGNVQHMMAELEVYQSEIMLVDLGQRVSLAADALPVALNGSVSEIGYAVEPQTTIRDDPAANTDARVIKVTVRLDEESSKLALRMTNLEVTGRIAVEAAP